MELPTVALPRPEVSRQPDDTRADPRFALPSAGAIWYEAPTPHGPLRLRAAGARLPARHAADAAIALQHCAPLLDELERWTGLDLTWVWSAPPDSETADAGAASATWRTCADKASSAATMPRIECRLDLPWHLLRSLPAPDPAWAERLQWASVPAVLDIAHLRLDPDDLRQLEPGGAVLLPPSLQPDWHGALRTLHESARAGSGVPVALNPAGRPRLVPRSSSADALAPAAAAAVHDDEPGAHEVRLAVERALPASHFTGWVDAEIAGVGTQASLWRCGSEKHPALCVAVGRLMPWGDGWALALESVWASATEETTQIV